MKTTFPLPALNRNYRYENYPKFKPKNPMKIKLRRRAISSILNKGGGQSPVSSFIAVSKAISSILCWRPPYQDRAETSQTTTPHKEIMTPLCQGFRHLYSGVRFPES